jgi:nucleoporin p58/p45
MQSIGQRCRNLTSFGRFLWIVAMFGFSSLLSSCHVSDPADTLDKDTIGQDTIGQDTIGQDTIGQDTIGQDTIGQDTIGQDTIGQDTITDPSVDMESGWPIHPYSSFKAGNVWIYDFVRYKYYNGYDNTDSLTITQTIIDDSLLSFSLTGIMRDSYQDTFRLVDTAFTSKISDSIFNSTMNILNRSIVDSSQLINRSVSDATSYNDSSIYCKVLYENDTLYQHGIYHYGSDRNWNHSIRLCFINSIGLIRCRFSDDFHEGGIVDVVTEDLTLRTFNGVAFDSSGVVRLSK